MIASIRVENIALIDRLELDLSEGLNILSGETGAGKSVLLNSINLILGERAERSLIRHGLDSARVEALLYPEGEEVRRKLDELGIPFEEDLVVARELTASGRNVCRINGRTVTLAALRTVMQGMVDLHGQHEHQSLLDPSSHVGLIDSFAGPKVSSFQKDITGVWQKLRNARRELEQIGGSPEERADTADLLRYQIRELAEAALRPGELEELEREQRRNESAEQLKRAMYRSYSALYDDERDGRDVLSGLQAAIEDLAEFEDIDERLGELLKAYHEAYYLLEDAERPLGDLRDAFEVDEERAQAVLDRIDEIHGLMRKYNVQDEAGLLESLRRRQRRLAQIEGAGARTEELAADIVHHEQELAALYTGLSAVRRKAAAAFAADIRNQLAELGMTDADFEVRFHGLESESSLRYGPRSPETAEFFISVNRGEPLRPLAKVASGGEISRIMLGFKVIAADHDDVGTLVFDEIDTGISGRTAQAVGEKMARVSLGRQIIAVTHLPQIAAMGDRNFYIHKESDGDRTVTHIDRLDTDGVRKEMIRLTGGLESENAEAHAEEMMAQAASVRARLRSENASLQEA